MRVGASVLQHARIKKMHAEGISPFIIARTINMTDQSLEKILAHLDGREEVTLALENSPEVDALRLENAELAARLAKFEDPESGEEATDETSETSNGPGNEKGGQEGEGEGEEESEEEST